MCENFTTIYWLSSLDINLVQDVFGPWNVLRGACYHFSFSGYKLITIVLSDLT